MLRVLFIFVGLIVFPLITQTAGAVPVVKLESDFGFSSGFVVGPGAVVTVGHSVTTGTKIVAGPGKDNIADHVVGYNITLGTGNSQISVGRPRNVTEQQNFFNFYSRDVAVLIFNDSPFTEVADLLTNWKNHDLYTKAVEWGYEDRYTTKDNTVRLAGSWPSAFISGDALTAWNKRNGYFSMMKIIPLSDDNATNGFGRGLLGEGASGGPLVDDKGKVCGIAIYSVRQDAPYPSYNIALNITSDTVQEKLNEAKRSYPSAF